MFHDRSTVRFLPARFFTSPRISPLSRTFAPLTAHSIQSVGDCPSARIFRSSSCFLLHVFMFVRYLRRRKQGWRFGRSVPVGICRIYAYRFGCSDADRRVKNIPRLTLRTLIAHDVVNENSLHEESVQGIKESCLNRGIIKPLRTSAAC